MPDYLIPLLAMTSVIMLAKGYGYNLPDPTRPADYYSGPVVQEAKPQKSTDWHLTAIRMSAEGRLAIVNGTLVRIGDEVESATVLEITSKSVVLDYNQKRLEINLVPQDIKKTPSTTGYDG